MTSTLNLHLAASPVDARTAVGTAVGTTAVADSAPELDQQQFRSVLGHFPTGVVVVTAIHDGEPVGMAIGSFTSVSLDPPMVAFLPARTSTTWPKIAAAGSFCVNVLAADQGPLCRTFASSGADKFADLKWHPAGSGSPILSGVVAWIDCEIENVIDSGDHHIVVGRVLDLARGEDSHPLVFWQGRYPQFSQAS